MSIETVSGESFRIELQLQPAEKGLQELIHWPEHSFSPDFAVATCGTIQIELNDKLIGERQNKLLLIDKTADLDGINSRLPDYLGGFVLNLGMAAVRIKEGAPQCRASFLDEPLSLYFRRGTQPGQVLVEFEAEKKPLGSATLSLAAFIAEITRTLKDFQRQVLALNSRLDHELDMKELALQLTRLKA